MSASKVVLLTGGSSGIGRAIALQLSQKGTKIVVAARNESQLKSTVQQCKKRGAQACYFIADVRDRDQCKAMVQYTIQQYGRIDVLILNAGISLHTPFENLVEEDLELYKKLIDVNYFGYLYPTFYALPHLKASKGSIGVVSSLSGQIGLPFRTGYCASKFAVQGFFESLRTEIGDQVSITIVSPGSVASNMRDNSLHGKKEGDIKFNESEESRMSVEEAAQEIARAVSERRGNVILTFSGKLGVILKPIVPSLIERMAIKKAGGVSKL
ncbi:hypothetical protein PROFUN_03521 [Planoprotostelium fungivorum]|uniref:Short chain dehydrogenase n=1 Tax=Planoprotostelium fungivorum TaxID=1890364 RepID=A0A2P6MND4_9EUKA|nr:hypothetical protein PROFUN_03521 [Planoprotostelium fungivorum]